MSKRSHAVVLTTALMASVPAFASPANHLITNFGDINVPFTQSVGNSFTAAAGGGFVSQDGSPVVTALVNGLNYFYDDFVFKLPTSPGSNFNGAAVSIDLGSFLSLQNFSARLYKLDNGVASLVTGLPSSGTPIQAWTNPALLSGGLTGTTVLFQNVSLQAGSTYALEFRGTINGTFGGSYGGNLNITPSVPEPDGQSLAFVALGIVGWSAARLRRVGA